MVNSPWPLTMGEAVRNQAGMGISIPYLHNPAQLFQPLNAMDRGLLTMDSFNYPQLMRTQAAFSMDNALVVDRIYTYFPG